MDWIYHNDILPVAGDEDPLVSDDDRSSQSADRFTLLGQIDVVQHSAVRYSAVQHKTVLCSVVQYSAIHCSTV